MVVNRPVSPSPTRPNVYVSRGNGAYSNTRQALLALDLSAVRARRVLLKPNVGRVAQPGSGVTTDPNVVAAAIDAFHEAGADVVVAESPIVGVRVQEALEASGITRVALDRNCPLIDLDTRRYTKVPVPEGRVIHSLKVCPDVLEADYVVSIPVMKMHMHTGVTLSVKNMKGCLWRRSKVELHMLPPVEGSDEKPIDIAIADMSSVLRADLAVIDGTVGMEGLGPSAGRAKPMDVVVVSTEAYAADAVACGLMGASAEGIPHLRIGAERGYGVIDLARIAVTPDDWQKWMSPFAPPPENLTIEFPNISVLDNNSCSACQSTLLLFLMRNRGGIFDYFPDQESISIAIGRGHTELPEGTLCIGNCTLPPSGKGIFVPGCPPVGSQILSALSGESAADSLDADGESADEGGP